VQQDLEEADDAGVVDLDPGIADRADGDRKAEALEQREVDVDVEPLRLAATLIAAKRLSPVELTRAYLDRIERFNSTLHAYVRVLHDDALAAARAAEAEIMADRHRGPLHGIPIGLKDIYDTTGIATEGGSKLCLGRIPARDATTTRRLKEAGAVLRSTKRRCANGRRITALWRAIG
jgi:Asp-tRNA(Asn)/Glu-tRNA(Gln) amidotransferase A subunit family amidase